MIAPEEGLTRVRLIGDLRWTDGPADLGTMQERLSMLARGGGIPKPPSLVGPPYDEFGTPNYEFVELDWAARWFHEQVAP
jgi:hypothetical protein